MILKGIFVELRLLLEVVAFRYRLLAFRGACVEPLSAIALLRVSPVPLIPQESHTLHFNQLVLTEKNIYIQPILLG